MKAMGIAREAIFAVKKELKDGLDGAARGKFRIAIDGNVLTAKGGGESWIVRAFNAADAPQPDSTMVVDAETGEEIQTGALDYNARIVFGDSGEESSVALLCAQTGVLWKRGCATMEEAVDAVTMHVAREMAESAAENST